MQNTFKKFVSAFVSLTTIVSSVGVGALALPGVASAATLSGGDLIKASGPAVYYYGGDGKRYVFPNEQTYKSWYKDFSGVKTISDSELAAVMIGGNVTTRPGTKLVKITTDPKTYAVTAGGVLHWIESEAVAKALYGDAWAARVVDVSDAFFVNYSIGSSLATNVHPDGSLVKYAGDSSLYVVSGGTKRKVASDAAAAANGLNADFAVMTTIAYGNGSDVTGRESGLADVAAVGTSSGTGSSGSLTASLASDTPSGMTVTRNASSVALVKVNLTAGGSDVIVNGLRFHRVGIGAVGDFTNVYLYDGSGKRLSTGRTINSSTNLVEFNSVNHTVAAGQTWSVLVYGDFAGSSATVGGEHTFRLEDAASVMVAGTATVGGSFPVSGQTFKVGSASSARLDVLKGSTPSNPTIGSKGVEISNFKLVANTNDIEVSQVTLYQAGSITNGDLTNLKLYQGATMVAQVASVGSDGRIFLKFEPAYSIPNGTTKVFSLKADVAGRADRTIKTYVEYTTDVTAKDKVYSSGAAVDIATNGTFDGTSSGTKYVEITTQGGQLTNAFNGPVTANVAKGKQGVALYKFTLTSPENALEIRNLRFTLAKTSGSASTCKIVGSSLTAYFRSLKIKNLDTGATVASKDLTVASSATTQDVTFTDTFNIAAAQTMNLAFVADLSNSEDSGDTFYDGACAYQVTFNPFQSNDVRVVDTGEFLALAKIVPNDTNSGNAQTVKASGLDIALASTPVSGTIVKKQGNVAIAGLALTAAAQSDVTITSLTLTGQAALSGLTGSAFGSAGALANLDTRVTSLKLMDGDTQVGLSKSPDTTSGAAQISNMNLVIPKGTTKNLSVVATFSSTASTTSPYDQISVGVALAGDVSAQDGDSNTVNPTLTAGVVANANGASPAVKQTILNNGTLSIQADSHPVANIVVAGKDAWMPFAQYKATAQYEAVNIDRIALYANSQAGAISADSADFAMVAIASAGAVKGQGTFSSGSTSTKDIDLSANNLVVPKDGSLQFQVWVKVASVQSSSSVSGATSGVARSGHAPLVGINNAIVTGEWDSNYGGSVLNVRSTGAASGERIYAASGAAASNAMVLRKTQPIVTKQSLSSATLANVDQDLVRFQVSADSGSTVACPTGCSVAWKQAMFKVTKSDGVVLQNFRLRRGSVDIDTSVVSITNATSGTDLVTGSIATGDTQAVTVVVAFASGQEESISGSGNVYTLHATVSGAGSGKSVTTQFYRDPTAPVVTGYLTLKSVINNTFATSTAIFHISTDTSPMPVATVTMSTGTFVWADNSEVPHSSALGVSSGSRDWTNDVYVTDLSQSQTVSL